jgi:hypothetical protein
MIVRGLVHSTRADVVGPAHPVGLNKKTQPVCTSTAQTIDAIV